MPKLKKEKTKTENSLLNLADRLVFAARKIVKESKNEDDLKIEFEIKLDPIKDRLGIKSERKFGKFIYKDKEQTERGFSDAMHGQVIIEYEPPGSFCRKDGGVRQSNINHAFDQLKDYFAGESKHSNIKKLLGIGFDGKKIFFVRYQGDDDKEIDENHYLMEGPFDFNLESAKTMLMHLRALTRLPLTAENLADKFGPDSELAPRIVSAFVNSLANWGNQVRVQTFFNEWKRIFGIIYGEKLSGYDEKDTKALAELYGVGGETDFQELLFAVHTYFAFLMKLIAVELLMMRDGTIDSSFSSELIHLDDHKFKLQLEDMEDGGAYARKGITNFLEGDFFRWYLETFESPELKDALREIARGLSEFEPGTTILEPASARDLLKKLYQYLVPKEIRHHLGEYYTPDWLAELVLNETGYNGDLEKRVLDPACGSGTFLVLSIQRAKEFGLNGKLSPAEIAKNIQKNIWGFDLNPLAVIASRTNYLFAMGDLVNEQEEFEIPIYLADSLLTPSRSEQDATRNFVETNTSVGIFQLPYEWVKNTGKLLNKATPLVEEVVKNQYSLEEAIRRFKKEGLILSSNQVVVENFFKKILELEAQNKNRIWARFLKNAFAPICSGKFDFVIGNPPWIRWDYLSKDYRNATLPLWKNYGLFSLKGFQAQLGGGKKDLSMLFVYAATDYYLKEGASLGFLITQELFKTKGAGEGFRRFQLGTGAYLKVLKAHDMASIQPFEEAANKTAVIILRKGEKTEYPLPYSIWTKKKGARKIASDMLLDEVLPLLEINKYSARPIGSNVGSWQTIKNEASDLDLIEGENFYKAWSGAWGDPYGVFWLNIKQILHNGNVLVENLASKGKSEIEKVEKALEPDLIFPAITGKEIKRWGASPIFQVLLVQDPKTRSGYPEVLMREKWPNIYSYLLNFKKILLERASYKKYHEDKGAPFYSQFNIGLYTFSKFKVVWKRMANDLIASVISTTKIPTGFKSIIPLDTTVFIPTDNEDEAHYLCAIINSRLVREFVKSFSSSGRGFGSASIMKHVGIPKFDLENTLHTELSKISKECHVLKFDERGEEIEKLEEELNQKVHSLFEGHKEEERCYEKFKKEHLDDPIEKLKKAWKTLPSRSRQFINTWISELYARPEMTAEDEDFIKRLTVLIKVPRSLSQNKQVE